MGILINEANALGREVPFFLPLNSDPLQGKTLHSFVDIGGGLTDEVKLRLPGGSFVSGTISQIAERGHGWYVYILTQGQTATPGTVYLDVNVPTAQPGEWIETIATQLSGILTGETIDARRELPFYLAQSVDPVNGPPITGYSFVTGEVVIRLPGGGGFVNADVTRVAEKGEGDYALRLTDSQVTSKGKVFIRVTATGAQPWSGFYDIVDPGAGKDVTAPTITNIAPVPGPLGTVGGFSSNAEVAKRTAITFDVADVAPGLLGVLIWCKFSNELGERLVHNGSRFIDPFFRSSIRSPIAGGFHYSVMMDGGWPLHLGEISFTVLPIDIDGNVTGGLPS